MVLHRCHGYWHDAQIRGMMKLFAFKQEGGVAVDEFGLPQLPAWFHASVEMKKTWKLNGLSLVSTLIRRAPFALAAVSTAIVHNDAQTPTAESCNLQHFVTTGLPSDVLPRCVLVVLIPCFRSFISSASLLALGSFTILFRRVPPTPPLQRVCCQ